MNLDVESNPKKDRIKQKKSKVQDTKNESTMAVLNGKCNEIIRKYRTIRTDQKKNGTNPNRNEFVTIPDVCNMVNYLGRREA